MVNEKLEINHNEMTFLKDMCHEQDSSVHHIENYLNKIVPIKTFGSICNLLHSTIGHAGARVDAQPPPPVHTMALPAGDNAWLLLALLRWE